MPIWSEDIVQQLRSLADQGFSASQAAANFPGMTRNSAVGLAFRRHFHFMGGKGGGPNHLSADSKPRKERMFIAKRSYRKVPEVVVESSAAVTEADVAPRRKVSIMELDESTCRFPMGDPLAADFGYCGAKPHPNYPYCPSCCILAYEQPETRHARSEQGRPRNGGFFNVAVRYRGAVGGRL